MKTETVKKGNKTTSRKNLEKLMKFIEKDKIDNKKHSI